MILMVFDYRVTTTTAGPPADIFHREYQHAVDARLV